MLGCSAAYNLFEDEPAARLAAALRSCRDLRHDRRHLYALHDTRACSGGWCVRPDGRRSGRWPPSASRSSFGSRAASRRSPIVLYLGLGDRPSCSRPTAGIMSSVLLLMTPAGPLRGHLPIARSAMGRNLWATHWSRDVTGRLPTIASSQTSDGERRCLPATRHGRRLAAHLKDSAAPLASALAPVVGPALVGAHDGRSQASRVFAGDRLRHRRRLRHVSALSRLSRRLLSSDRSGAGIACLHAAPVAPTALRGPSPSRWAITTAKRRSRCAPTSRN